MNAESNGRRHWALSRRRMAFPLAGGLMMTPMLLWMSVAGLRDGDFLTTIIGPPMTAFMGLCTAIAARGVVRGGGVTLTDDGLRMSIPVGSAFVPWTSIERTNLGSYAGRTFLGVVLRPGARAQVSFGLRLQRSSNRHLPGDVNVPPTVPDLEGLRDAIQARLAAQGRPESAQEPQPT